MIALFSMDYTVKSPKFLLSFGFECKKGTESIWWIEKTVKSGTLWELHIIIVFMYTTLAIIVLSTIPFKYDRLVKTEKEIKAEEDRARKKRMKKLKKKGEIIEHRNSVMQSIHSHEFEVTSSRDASKTISSSSDVAMRRQMTQQLNPTNKTGLLLG